MDNHDQNALPPEAHILLLQMQIDQLEAKLEEEIRLHKQANHRAAHAVKRSDRIKAFWDKAEGDLGVLAQCWSCASLGKIDQCNQCSNSSIFVWNGTSFEWRGIRDKE